jgi:hypothetical protein
VKAQFEASIPTQLPAERTGSEGSGTKEMETNSPFYETNLGAQVRTGGNTQTAAAKEGGRILKGVNIRSVERVNACEKTAYVDHPQISPFSSARTPAQLESATCTRAHNRGCRADRQMIFPRRPDKLKDSLLFHDPSSYSHNEFYQFISLTWLYDCV